MQLSSRRITLTWTQRKWSFREQPPPIWFTLRRGYKGSWSYHRWTTANHSLASVRLEACQRSMRISFVGSSFETTMPLSDAASPLSSLRCCRARKLRVLLYWTLHDMGLTSKLFKVLYGKFGLIWLHAFMDYLYPIYNRNAYSGTTSLSLGTNRRSVSPFSKHRQSTAIQHELTQSSDASACINLILRRRDSSLDSRNFIHWL